MIKMSDSSIGDRSSRILKKAINDKNISSSSPSSTTASSSTTTISSPSSSSSSSSTPSFKSIPSNRIYKRQEKEQTATIEVKKTLFIINSII
jgi:hypothetical protein